MDLDIKLINIQINEGDHGHAECCPECGILLEHHDSGVIGICGRPYNWISLKCPECGFLVSNEPDID